MPSQSLTKEELAALSSRIAQGDTAALEEVVTRTGLVDGSLKESEPKDNLLLEEYKLLQAKIDKASDYRFTVRGWSATIILGLLLGSSAASAPSYILLFAVPVVVLFWLMEEQQNDIQNTLQKRALGLERVLQKAPGAQRYQDPNPYGDPIGPVPGIATALNRSGRGATGRKRTAQRSASLFYSVQLLLIAIAVCWAYFVPTTKKEPTPQNVYYFNAADNPQAPEQPNGKSEDQRSKGKPPKR